MKRIIALVAATLLAAAGVQAKPVHHAPKAGVSAPAHAGAGAKSAKAKAGKSAKKQHAAKKHAGQKHAATKAPRKAGRRMA